MELERLYPIVQRWMDGQITGEEQHELKTLYLSEVGATPGCKTCPSFWSDVKHHFRYHLKQNGYYTMSTKKYKIAGNGIFFHYASGTGYANEGPYNSNRHELTDEIAEAFLKQNPDLKSQIIANPDYKAPKGSEAIASDAKPAKPATPPRTRTPKAKPVPPATPVENSSETEETN
jgi:hypothetical protein